MSINWESLMASTDNIVTNGVAGWDGVMTDEAIQRVADLEKLDNTGVRASGKGRIRPSLIGDRCTRKVCMSYLGMPTNPERRAAFNVMDDGTQRHYLWQKVGLSAGFLVDIERQVDLPEMGIRGQLDGWLSDDTVFELKCTNPVYYKRLVTEGRPTRSHRMQVAAYMMATGATRASIVYELRSYAVEFIEFRIDLDDEDVEDLRQQVDDVHESLGTAMPNPLDECIARTGAYKYCPFSAECMRIHYAEGIGAL